MKRSLTIIFLTALLILAALPVAAQETELAGNWVGGYEANGNWTFIEAQFWRAGDSYQGKIDLGGDSRRWQLISNVSLNEAGDLSISWDNIKLNGKLDGDKIIGA